MKGFALAALAAATAAGSATAGGLDRSGLPITPLFEKGTYVEFSLGAVQPEVTGQDAAFFGGSSIGDVADDYLQLGFAYKRDLNERLSFALIYDQPFGADIEYPASSIALGGTRAVVDSDQLSAILRYKLNDRFSIHAGVRADWASAEVALNGAAYGGVSGYNVSFKRKLGFGYLIGAAYEIPDIALRVALTYNSEIRHDFATIENFFGPSTTRVDTPQSVNLDFQTGIMKDTLLFGTIRWAEWSAFKVDPAGFVGATGSGLVSLDDSITYTLGVARRFNEGWAGALSVTYEEKGDPLVSPLAPTNGKFGVTLAAIRTVGKARITTGINYTWLGDAQPQTAGAARASMTDNHALGLGLKIGYNF